MSISLTVPMERKALTAAATMLQTLAEGIATPVPGCVKEMSAPDVAQVVEAVSENTCVPVEELIKPIPVPTEAATVPAPGEVFAQEEPAPTGVQVDSEGLPWDARIHASSKAFLARPAGAWKKKRGLEPAVLASIEAELLAAMAVPSPASAPVETVASTPAPTPPVMEVPDESTPGDVSTFPQLIQAITAKQIDQATVLAACKSAGLQALPLLAGRPDLVPIVARVLGL